MTKINKLGKSTFVIAILSFILVAVLSFGGTYAYFSATAGQVAGKVTTGHLRLTADGTAVTQIGSYAAASNTIVEPGQILVGTANADGTNTPKNVDAEVTSNINYYLRVKFDVKVTTGDTVWDEDEDKWIWQANPNKKHNGVIHRDNPLTEENEGADDSEAEADAADVTGEAGKIDVDNKVDEDGDNVSDDISILEILLKVGFNGAEKVEWKELTSFYTVGDHDDDEGTPDQRYLKTNGHTGYFYGAGAYDSEPTKYTAPADGTDTFEMDVLVNIQDWVGAYGCTYYMDAGIEIHFQVEVLQADYLEATKLGLYWGTGTQGTDASAPAPTTIAELHEAWDKAVVLSQD